MAMVGRIIFFLPLVGNSGLFFGGAFADQFGSGYFSSLRIEIVNELFNASIKGLVCTGHNDFFPANGTSCTVGLFGFPDLDALLAEGVAAVDDGGDEIDFTANSALQLVVEKIL